MVVVHRLGATHIAAFRYAQWQDAAFAPYAMSRLLRHDLRPLEDEKFFEGPLATRWIGTAMSRSYVLGPRFRWCT